MFYFAAGINLVMALWVLSVGARHRSRAGTLWLIVLVFLALRCAQFLHGAQAEDGSGMRTDAAAAK